MLHKLLFKLYFTFIGLGAACWLIACMDDLPEVRGPYLSWKASPKTTITITWESLNNSADNLRWGHSADALDHPVTVTPRKRRDDMYFHYSFTITGLSADTRYYYQVNGLQDVPATFRTAPADRLSPFSFLLYGDSCEFDATRQNQHYGVARKMNEVASGLPVGFIISSGDLTPDDPDVYGWDLHFDAIRHLADHLPYFTPFGNHDWNRRDPHSHFLSAIWIHEFPEQDAPGGEVMAFNETSYAFAYGNAYFVFIGYDQIGAPPGSDFTKWLTRTLSFARQHYAFTFVDMHEPPFDRRDDGYMDNVDVLKNQAPLFHQYDVTAVFAGHNHLFAHHEISKQVSPDAPPVSVMYLISGGGGQTLRSAHPGVWNNRYGLGYSGKTVFTRSLHHFVRVDIHPGKMMVTFTVISLDGNVVYGPYTKISGRERP